MMHVRQTSADAVRMIADKAFFFCGINERSRACCVLHPRCRLRGPALARLARRLPGQRRAVGQHACDARALGQALLVEHVAYAGGHARTRQDMQSAAAAAAAAAARKTHRRERR